METSTTSEKVISVTENAAMEIRSMLANPENQGKTLRVYVEQGGCSGMQYAMVYDEKRPDDFLVEMHGVCVLVDPFSAKFLRGWIELTLSAKRPGSSPASLGGRSAGAAIGRSAPRITISSRPRIFSILSR